MGRGAMGEGLVDTQLRFSVVVCAYTEQRWDHLVAAIGSLDAQTHPPEEVIVVVDHTPALAQRCLSELPDVIPGVICVENRGRQGLSDARNTGLESAHG